MAHGDPSVVRSYKSDIWIGDVSLAQLVGPVVYLDPPLAAVRSAQVPLITSVHTFCFCRLKTAAHRIEHLLRRRINVVGYGDGRTDEHGHRDNANVSTSRAHCSIRRNRKTAPINVINAPASRITRSPVPNTRISPGKATSCRGRSRGDAARSPLAGRDFLTLAPARLCMPSVSLSATAGSGR